MRLKKGISSSWQQFFLGPFWMACLVFLGFFSWCYVPAFAVWGLCVATVSLGALSLRAGLETFLATCVLAVGIVCTTKHHPLAVIVYAMGVFLPLIVVNLYKVFAKKKGDITEVLSVFQCLSSVFFVVTLVVSRSWRLFLVEEAGVDKGLALAHWVVFCAPGLFVFLVASVVTVLVLTFARKVSYPMPKGERFVVSGWDYGWLAFQEGMWVFYSLTSGHVYPPNLFFAALVPFMMRGLLVLQGGLAARKWKEGAVLVTLLSSIVLFLPLCFFTLYALFEPWVKVVVAKNKNRKVGNGNR